MTRCPKCGGFLSSAPPAAGEAAIVAWCEQQWQCVCDDCRDDPPGVERGPEPATSLPWGGLHGGVIWYALLNVAQFRDDDDRDATLHRVNNWDALFAELERLRAERDELAATVRRIRDAERGGD